jgi:chromosome segregation ATPase
MNEQYFPKLMKLLTASVGLLFLSAATNQPALSILGILPLLIYHWRILVPATQTGLISALHIAISSGETDILSVVLNFGIGLIATGYAVFARMHLNSLAPVSGTYTEEQVMDRYVQRSAQLVDHIERSTTKLSDFATEIIARTAATAETIQQTAEQNMRRTSAEFASDIANILEDVREALDGIQELVTDADSQAARTSFNTELRETYRAGSELNAAMRELAQHTAQESKQRAETITTTKSLALHLQDFSEKMRKLGAEDGAIAISAQTLGAVSGGLVSSSQTVIEALETLHEVGALVQDTGPTFSKMRTMTKKATEQLETLAEATEHLRQAGENVQYASDASSALNSELARMCDVLPTLNVNSQRLSATFDSAGKSTRAYEERISAIPTELDAVHALQQGIASALDQITGDLRAASEQSRKVREHGASNAAAVDGASALLAGAARLDDTISSIQNRLSGLLDAIGSVNSAIQSTSEGFQSYAQNYKNQHRGSAPSTLPRSVNPRLDRSEELLP